MLALSAAMQTLDLTADALTADVKAIIAHRTQTAAHAVESATVAELESQEKSWNKEEEELEKRKKEIRAMRGRLHSATQMKSAHGTEVRELVSAHPRVLADLTVAVAKVLAGPVKAYQPQMISSRDQFVKTQDVRGQFVGNLG